ncbi:MAG TPA: phosphonate C-P lyase system protein PhnG [Slackia equolifaciens]|uniref:Phosphonate C-P lyase system protein PhnG n=1 Tax=Slackia equolifaciens TaxID=498718 RepID=A0A9D2UVF3_9ACTN|nr:phosphonate C-P lyase system protein PhnG [Slackia equolifaciens]
MRRRERTRILVDGDRSLARSMAAEVERAFPVEVLDDPREGLVMVKVRESAKRQTFYLGEALMTSCRVKAGDARGLGIVMGDDRELAFDLALIDAAFAQDGGPIDTTRWEERLRAERARIDAERALEQAVTGKTRVDFSTMEVEL